MKIGTDFGPFVGIYNAARPSLAFYIAVAAVTVLTLWGLV